MVRYGLFVFTHHSWSKVLVVMSAEGASATAAALGADPDIAMTFEEGRLPQFAERCSGAMAAFIERHGIELQDHKAWAAKKAELGQAVYR